MHTVKTFWTGKRFLKLFIFALLLGNLTFYCVGMLAKRQVVANAVSRHNKIYTAYLQAVERARKGGTDTETLGDAPGEAAKPATPTGAATAAQPGPVVGPAPAPTTAVAPPKAAPISPYAIALHELRRQFPYYKVDVVAPGTPEGERERRVIEVLKTRSSGWMVSDSQEGWARSFYVLPTKTVAALEVQSDVRDDFGAWETTTAIIAGYAFLLLLAFGWFWTRALEDSNSATIGEGTPEVRRKIAAIQGVTAEVGNVLGEVKAELAALQARQGGAAPEALRNIDDLAAQIRLLAVNGSIEAARSADTYRVFHVLMQEINQLATHLRAQLKGVGQESDGFTGLRSRIDELQSRVSGAEAGVPPRSAASSSAGTSFRRVG
ncbi:MAG: methyl-accepting chemotaxis protein [Deltaproteobacteria bacterium]|nr:methyl-accepting chemotaxis protein [Deltaproteobacteria bacterium]